MGFASGARWAAGLVLALAVGCTPARGGGAARVVAVHDGDTVTVLRDGAQVRVRLACIDAPERGQAFGSRAKQSLSELVMGRRVSIQEVDTDQYGRLVARLTTSDGDVSLAMVRSGLAWHYVHHCPNDEALRRAQSEARSSRLGLWRDPDPVAPWQWRHPR